MPIYEYQCGACGHRLEAMQKMSDDPLTECPECGRPDLRKLISAAGFQLKGTGWYVTDFKDSGRKKAKEGAKAVSGDGSGAKEQKSEGKSEGGGESVSKTPKTSESKD